MHVTSGKLTKCYIHDMRRLYDKLYNKRFPQTTTAVFTQLEAKIITQTALCLPLLSSLDFTLAILFYIITENSVS